LGELGQGCAEEPYNGMRRLESKGNREKRCKMPRSGGRDHKGGEESVQ